MTGYYREPVPPAPDGLAAIGGHIYAGTEAGPLGSVIEAYFVDEADYRYVGSPGAPYYDVATSAGSPVRVRPQDSPGSVTAVIAVDGGSIVAVAYDVDEGELIAALDGISLGPQREIVWDETLLPERLSLLELGPHDGRLDQYHLRSDEGDSIHLVVTGSGTWSLALGQRHLHPNPEVVEQNGYRAIVYGQENTDWPGAVYDDGEFWYQLTVNPPDPADEPWSVEEVKGVLVSLVEVEWPELVAKLGLVSRHELIGEWIDNTPLPEGIDLSWMLAGDTMSPAEEAFMAHEAFVCAWVGEWIATGEPAALATIEDSDGWPSARVLANSDHRARPRFRSIEQASTLTRGPSGSRAVWPSDAAPGPERPPLAMSPTSSMT